MPNLAFSFELKSVNAEGTFTGLASTYGNIDQGGDVVLPGAFTRTLNASAMRPLLWQHHDPIGTVSLKDTPAGLLANGKLILDVQRAREALSLMRDKAVRGLSIGFQSVRDSIKGGIRQLEEIKLYEVSLTPFPMNEAAVITSIKSADAENIIRVLHGFKSDILSALMERN